MGKDLKGKEPKICVKVIISMMKSLEIKGFIGGNIKNEIRNRRPSERRQKYII